MKKEKYKIGDFVKVKNSGSCYSTYSEIFEKFGFKNLIVNSCNKHDVGVIFNMCVHPQDSQAILLAIRNSDKEFLIGQNGVEPILTAINETYDIY